MSSQTSLTDHGFERIDDPHEHICFAIILWHNEWKLQIGDEGVAIGDSSEPSLSELVESVGGTFTGSHASAHEDLLDWGYLEEGYIARQKCDWMLTPKGKKRMQDYFFNNKELVRDWQAEMGDAPFGWVPAQESMLHRKAVAHLIHMVRQTEGVEVTALYPEKKLEGTTFDVGIKRNEEHSDLIAEVVTSDSIDHDVNKWNKLNLSHFPTIWLFDKSETAARFFNRAHENDVIRFAQGQFPTPESWRMSSIEDRLSRNYYMSYKHQQYYLLTLTQAMERDGMSILEEFQETIDAKNEPRPISSNRP